MLGEVFLYSSKAKEGYAWGGILYLWVGLSVAAFWCLSCNRVDVGKRDGKKLEIETAKLAKVQG